MLARFNVMYQCLVIIFDVHVVLMIIAVAVVILLVGSAFIMVEAFPGNHLVKFDEGHERVMR